MQKTQGVQTGKFKYSLYLLFGKQLDTPVANRRQKITNRPKKLQTAVNKLNSQPFSTLNLNKKIIYQKL
jgi:hypothetical protein